jgi:hypothetical protein
MRSHSSWHCRSTWLVIVMLAFSMVGLIGCGGNNSSSESSTESTPQNRSATSAQYRGRAPSPQNPVAPPPPDGLMTNRNSTMDSPFASYNPPGFAPMRPDVNPQNPGGAWAPGQCRNGTCPWGNNYRNPPSGGASPVVYSQGFNRQNLVQGQVFGPRPVCVRGNGVSAPC